MKLELVRGMRDVVGDEAVAQRVFKERAASLLDSAGYQEVILPSIEYYDLIAAKAGQELLDSLYEFMDRGGRKVALTPELTASATRLYVTRFRDAPKPVKLWYVGPCFRYDEPQRGRYRQFTQLGVEVFGSSSPLADAEVVFIAASLLKSIGIDTWLKVGNISFLRALLQDSGLEGSGMLSAIRSLDHGRYEEVEGSLNARGKKIMEELMGSRKGDLDYWEGIAESELPSAVHGLRRLKKVVELIRAMLPAVEINVDVSFARGLAYYTDFIFEAYSHSMGEALLGGGRYDNLVEELGGPPTPAVGFATGVDRVALLVKAPEVEKVALVVPLDEDSLGKAGKAFSAVSGRPGRHEMVPGPMSARDAIERALKGSFHYVVLAGNREGPEEVVLRDLSSRTQKTVKLKELAQAL